MNKLEKERLYKSDLARYLKNDFAEYKKVADMVNYIYKSICQQEGSSKPTNIAKWNEVKDIKNNLQHKIERKLPRPDLFNSIYRYYGILLRDGTINKPITDEEVLKLVNGAKPNDVGKLKPIGTRFIHIDRPGKTYIIKDIKSNGYLTYGREDSDVLIDYPISLFQNNLKNGKIMYKGENNEI